MSLREPAVRRRPVHSVDRAISVLQVLARHGGAGVTEIATALGVHKSTVSRLLGTLESRGLVESGYSRDRYRYRLAYGVVQLAAVASNTHDLSVISRPLCHELAETVGETVNVAVSDGRAVISIDQVIGSATITSMDWVGHRAPMHATSAGKVFLADLPSTELKTVLGGGLERYTERTVVDPEVLEQQLAVVRDTGYARTVEEHEIGLAAVAAPIRSLDGRVIAALTISGPTFRIGENTVVSLIEHLLSTAAEISERNGYPRLG